MSSKILHKNLPSNFPETMHFALHFTTLNRYRTKSLNRYYFTALNHYRATLPSRPPPLPLSPLFTSFSHCICARCADKSTYPPILPPIYFPSHMRPISRQNRAFSLPFINFSLDFQKIFCYNIKKNHFFYRLGAFSP